MEEICDHLINAGDGTELKLTFLLLPHDTSGRRHTPKGSGSPEDRFGELGWMRSLPQTVLFQSVG